MKDLSVEVNSTEDSHVQCVVTQPSQQEFPEGKSARRNLQRRRSRKRRIGGNFIPNSEDDFEFFKAEPLSENSFPFFDIFDSKWEGYGAKLARSLPLLMYERELYGNGGRRQTRRVCPWQTRLQKPAQNTRASTLRVWRASISQSFKFHHLGTSVGDAVLGLDPTGSFFVALGEEHSKREVPWNAVEHGLQEQDIRHSLMLRFYALPKMECGYLAKARQLLSIPLLESYSTYSNGSGNEFGEESSFWMYTPVRTPVRVWLCTDGWLGACMYRTSMDLRNPSANIVLFPLPRVMMRSNRAFAYHHLSHVHVPCQAKQDLSPSADCNMLYRTPFFPVRNSSAFDSIGQSWLCNSVTEGIPSYLFLVDEEDGFRLTWITGASWRTRECRVCPVESLWQNDCHINGASKQDPKQSFLVRSNADSCIVVQVSDADAGWEVVNSDQWSEQSHRLHTESADHRHLEPLFNINFTGFLSAASLLKDILVRRPHLVTPQFCDKKAALPIFTYHLVQVNMGRIAEILLIFSVGPIGKGCLGVFVEVDLLTQDYREIEWLRHGSSDAPPAGCGNLAFSRRKKICFSRTGSVPKRSMGGLLEDMYPDCVTMSNLAVRIQVPVKSMCARSAPVQIDYC
jgi:hypothetical protein